MTLSRRHFLSAVAGAGAVASSISAASSAVKARPVPAGRFDPWLEVDPTALRHNTEVVSRLSEGRPILAVIKNNAYGLGLLTVADVLDGRPEIAGFAVVKADAALALRDAGIRKPVLLMGLFAPADEEELVVRGVQLSLCTDDSPQRAARAGRRTGRPVEAHFYLDTGMSRMGIPYHRALAWIRANRDLDIQVQGAFMGFTEDEDFDREQLARFNSLAAAATAEGLVLGRRHAASSHAVFHLPAAHLDMVRPGIALFGAYPSDARRESEIARLECAVRLRARVVRVERLRAGDSVSYGRNYIAQRPTWVATLPVGHTDGVPRGAVNGARVLVRERTFPVVGAVSASHTIIEVGEERAVDIGDVATLLGPDHPAIRPNRVAEACGVSVYDVLMHLSPGLPKYVVS